MTVSEVLIVAVTVPFLLSMVVAGVLLNRRRP